MRLARTRVGDVGLVDALRRVRRAGEPVLLLDSCADVPALTAADRAFRRRSFLAAAPAESVVVRGDRAWRRDAAGAWAPLPGAWDAFRATDDLLSRAPRLDAEPDAPPFAGGVAGLVAYDAARAIERVPALARDDAAEPDAHLSRFPAVVAWDHERGVVEIVHADDAEGRAAGAEIALRLASPTPPAGRADAARPTPTLARGEFEDMVARALDRVHAGDAYQVNLSHRLETRLAPGADPVTLYARLRRANPAPMSGALLAPLPDGREVAVLSSSPERLFSLDADGRLEARPIAGTRPRGATPAADSALASELARDEKERAEHVMLVDLARNDLGRVAEFGSVRVPRLLDVETYARVHHLVSIVEARLAEGRTATDALRALFPGGTITGAPKVEAMRIIERIEPARRGAYTGALGYASATGAADWNILIRTLVVEAAPRGPDGPAGASGREVAVRLQVGAGVVWDSRPEREWAETLAKASAILAAFDPPEGTSAIEARSAGEGRRAVEGLARR